MLKNSEAMTILVIEEDIDIQNFLARVLGLEGYRVLKTSDGETGLETIRNNAVSLVLLSLRPPACDNWTVLQELRRDASLSEIPVIVITTAADAMHRSLTLEMGANAYLVKPIGARSLIENIARILQPRTPKLKV